MSACASLAANASAGVAPALRAVDCLASENTAAAFGRLFGSQGGLLPALTALLTLYIAFFAFSLLTGRSSLSISALTPRMLTLGMVLTFATSWVAYQGVVWNLAVGAPDQIAGVLMGAKGSATQLFADRVDIVFAAIAEVSGGGGAQGAPAGAEPSGSFTPANVMWLGALLLLLGTVGVLVTARIALAVLLALGPVFVVFALFPGTRGLTAGWLRGVALTALTPLFVVIGGGLMLELLVPVVAALRSAQGGVDGRAALALFLIASVHVALMAMVLKVSGAVVSAWDVFGLGRSRAVRGEASAAPATAAQAPATIAAAQAPAASPVATRTAVLSAAMVHEQAGASTVTSSHTRTIRDGRVVAAPVPAALPARPQLHARGIGSRFAQRPAARPALAREIIR